MPAVRVLAGFALVGSLAATTGDVFKATGRSVLIFRIGLVHSAVLWTGLALLAPRGIAWAGFAVSLAATVSGATAFGCAILALGVRPGMLARVLATPLGATVAMTAVLLGARAVPVAPGAVRLVGLTLVAIAAYVGSHALLAPGDVREVGGALAAVRERRDAHARALAAG